MSIAKSGKESCKKYSPHPVFPENGCLGTMGSFAAAQRDGYKRTEDRIIYEKVSKDCHIFGVFDGHGGMYVVDYVSTHLPNVIKQQIIKSFYSTSSSSYFHGEEETPKEIQLSPEIIQEILIQAFLQVDDNLMNDESKPNFEGGTTATIAVVTSRHIVVANLGDSPSFTFSKIKDLEDGHKIIDQIENHVPNNLDECKRVTDNGGKIASEPDGSKRVDGFLSITRAFGHRKYKTCIPPKKQIISSLPQTYIWNRTTDMMLVLCTDSFTEAICTQPKLAIRNVLENDNIMRAISKCIIECNYDLKKTVNILCDRQIEKFNFPKQGYAGDNTSIILIDFIPSSTLSLTSSSSSPLSCNSALDDESTTTDQSFSNDNKSSTSFSTLYARCLAEGGLPGKDLSGIKRTSNCLMNEIPGTDSYEKEEETRARSYSRSDDTTTSVSSSRTTPFGTPNRSRNSSFTSDFNNFLHVSAGNISANSSWMNVNSNPQSPLQEICSGSVYVNQESVGLSFSPSTNSGL